MPSGDDYVEEGIAPKVGEVIRERGWLRFESGDVDCVVELGETNDDADRYWHLLVRGLNRYDGLRVGSELIGFSIATSSDSKIINDVAVQFESVVASLSEK